MAGPSGTVGSRRRRCDGAAACASAAHGTRSVVGDQGTRPGQHVGSRKVKSREVKSLKLSPRGKIAHEALTWDGVREATSRRPRRRPSASRAHHARLRCSCRRCGARRPPAKACSGHRGPLGPPVAVRGRLNSAPSASGGGAVTAPRSAPARRTARGEPWATRARSTASISASEKSSQVK